MPGPRDTKSEIQVIREGCNLINITPYSKYNYIACQINSSDKERTAASLGRKELGKALKRI